LFLLGSTHDTPVADFASLRFAGRIGNDLDARQENNS
jgi:hypothetical protein